MGDRFYQAQIKHLGTCPGYNGKRKKNMAWDDDKRAKAIELYVAEDPTPKNSVEILGMVAEELGETVNSVRAILSKAGVYVKKDGAAATSAAAKADKPASTRVSKEAAHAKLTAALEAAGKPVDAEIISKLTGKAALYFADVVG